MGSIVTFWVILDGFEERAIQLQKGLIEVVEGFRDLSDSRASGTFYWSFHRVSGNIRKISAGSHFQGR